MFGESETGESPRVPSPWDALTSDRQSNPSPPLHLVQESDDGNIEYKLHLLNPSERRFSRLTTQLKFRLLEGGGQAYYELGVADSGALIGLTREDLEQTLETLESMAAELGASVIVVKEIEVLAGMSGLDAFWRRRQCCSRMESSGESSATETETETETEVTTDSEDYADTHFSDTHSSPSSKDSSPTVYSEPVNPTLKSYSLVNHAQSQTQLSVGLEISTVYKPRPAKTVRSHSTSAPKVKSKPCPRKKQKYDQPHQPLTGNEASLVDSRARQQEKAKVRLIARDCKRDEERHALTGITTLADPNRHIDSTSALDQNGEQNRLSPDERLSAQAQLVSDLQSLHVSLSVSPTLPSAPHIVGINTSSPTIPIPVPTINITSYSSSLVTASTSSTSSCSCQSHSRNLQPTPNSGAPRPETRFIVEALVVRKLSLEEAYLDFGGFTLI